MTDGLHGVLANLVGSLLDANLSQALNNSDAQVVIDKAAHCCMPCCQQSRVLIQLCLHEPDL